MVARSSKEFPFNSGDVQKILQWAMKKKYFSFLNGNDYETLYGSFPTIIFAGRRCYIKSDRNSFDKLESLLATSKEWLFGYFSYDLKNEIEDLTSKSPATIPVARMYFIVPETIIFLKEQCIVITSYEEPQKVYREIVTTDWDIRTSEIIIDKPRANTTKKQYFERVKRIKNAIVEGEFYEMNFCIEYTARAKALDPVHCYQKINEISPTPFSAFMGIGHHYLICASPERFLKKTSDKIISQPIKGTIRRSPEKVADDQLRHALLHSEKERAENLMIVDLVRNDLAKSSLSGSVKVEELFGIYTFKNVHQMISTVTSTHNKQISVPEIIKNAFPMGSMTGAPKIRVMKEIEDLEYSSRALYSGAIGYFTPDHDFDLNVVIRSIIYDEKNNILSFHVGSAITYDSDPAYEYNECLLKAKSIFEVLSN